MKLEELKKYFTRNNIRDKEKNSAINEYILEISEEERNYLAKCHEPSKQAIQEERNVTKAGIRLLNKCYTGGKKIQFKIFYPLTCAAAGKEIRNPNQELKKYKEKNRTKTRAPPKPTGNVRRIKMRVYGIGSADRNPRG